MSNTSEFIFLDLCTPPYEFILMLEVLSLARNWNIILFKYFILSKFFNIFLVFMRLFLLEKVNKEIFYFMSAIYILMYILDVLYKKEKVRKSPLILFYLDSLVFYILLF